MKKKTKKIMISALVVGIATPSLYYSLFTENNNVSNTKQINQIAYMDADNVFQQRELNKSYEESLIENFGENYEKFFSNSEKSIKESQSIEILLKQNNEYPDYYGGMYIDSDGNLVFQKVKDSNPKVMSNDINVFISFSF